VKGSDVEGIWQGPPIDGIEGWAGELGELESYLLAA
jgi:hypothetical protein